METKTVAIGLGAAAAIGGLIYLATRAEAAPPGPPEPQPREEWDHNSRLCPYCGEVYASFAILLEHIHIEHPGLPDPVEVPIF